MSDRQAYATGELPQAGDIVETGSGKQFVVFLALPESVSLIPVELSEELRKAPPAMLNLVDR